MAQHQWRSLSSSLKVSLPRRDSDKASACACVFPQSSAGAGSSHQLQPQPQTSAFRSEEKASIAA
eukprot:6321451-Amphidinium_carterae.1